MFKKKGKKKKDLHRRRRKICEERGTRKRPENWVEAGAFLGFLKLVIIPTESPKCLV